MKWQELGVVWSPDGSHDFAQSHAMGPTPILVNDDVIRIYITCLDENKIGRPTFIEVSSHDPTKVLNVNQKPLLEVGAPGTFDDSGLMVTSVVKVSESKYYLYYAGFELSTKIRYRILTGVAISDDGGLTFSKYSSTPILERSDEERFIRGGPFVSLEADVFKMWYVGGNQWIDLSGKQMPVYDIKFLESEDGFHWGANGLTVLPISQNDEHGFGRPWVLKNELGTYDLFYSIRRISLMSYRLGYATSSNGIVWERNDREMNLNIAENSINSDAIMYAAVLNVGKRTFCFYNGNNFGEMGFSVAEKIK